MAFTPNFASKPIVVDILVPLAGAGGVENVVAAAAGYLNRNGFHVRVVQLISDGRRWLSPDIELYPILFNQKVENLEALAPLYTAFLQQYGVPALVITVTWPYLILTAKKALANFPQACKVVSWLHGPLSEYDKYGAGGIECMRPADYHLCISKKAQRLILSDNPAARTALIYNPVDFKSYTPRKEADPASRTLLFVGRLSAEKHPELAIRALALTESRWSLRIIGDGDMRPQLESLVKELGLEQRVDFLGWKSNPWDFCGNAAALVLASEYEGFPLAAVESMANGIPVISTPVDGITELIQPGINGYLYPMGDAEGLARILTLLADGSLPSILPENCRQSALPFEQGQVLKRLREALLNALDTISVIIPCYNVQEQIRRCLDSLLAQTLDRARLEIICVDDCSTDATLEILQEYETACPELFLLIPLSENRKQGYARNIALSYASGSYIAYVDADDCIDARMLEELYNAARLYKCDVVECGYKQFTDETEIPAAGEHGSFIYLHMDNPDEKKWYVLNRYWKTSPWGRLYRKELLAGNGISFAENCRMEDILFSAQCMKYMKNYLFLPVTYYYYYVNRNGTMFGNDIGSYYMDTALVQNMAADFLHSFHWYDDCYEEYAYLHYTKAFEEPLWRMMNDFSFFSYNNIMELKRNLLCRFPDIAQNRYIVDADNETTHICLTILKNEFTKEALKEAFQN